MFQGLRPLRARHLLGRRWEQPSALMPKAKSGRTCGKSPADVVCVCHADRSGCCSLSRRIAARGRRPRDRTECPHGFASEAPASLPQHTIRRSGTSRRLLVRRRTIDRSLAECAKCVAMPAFWVSFDRVESFIGGALVLRGEEGATASNCLRDPQGRLWASSAREIRAARDAAARQTPSAAPRCPSSRSNGP